MGLSTAKLGWLNFKRRKTGTILIIIGLLISTSVITGSLVVGDSMTYFVEESTYRNLGEVDVTVTSFEFFSYELFTTLDQDSELARSTDKMAPLIRISGSAKNDNTNAFELKCNLIGINDRFYEFGEFVDGDDNKVQPQLSGNEVVINTEAAENLDANLGDTITVTVQNPVSSLESIYIDFDQSRTLELSLKVQNIVQDQDLGNFQLQGHRTKISTIFIDQEHLQTELEMEDEINTIIISNKGDKRVGVEYDSEVSSRLGKILDDQIGHLEVGLELETTENYFMLSSSEIFFKYDYYELMTDLQTELVGTDNQIHVSPILTYFVNSIAAADGESISYSTVTGFDPDVDYGFGSFIESETGAPISGSLAPDEIILNNWSAAQLNVSPGDVVKINYSVIDRLYNIEAYDTNLTVKSIVDIDAKASDRNLMPAFPGLQGMESCLNWDPPFPLDLEAIEDSDVDYWQLYQGTPKGYILLDTARTFWANDLGDLTGIKILPDKSEAFQDLSAAVLDEYRDLILAHLDANIGYSDAGLTINTVKTDSLETARGLSIFPMMFLAFGMIIILAGILLIVNIFITQAEARRFELGLIRALGFKRRQLTKILVVEGLLYAIIASILGVICGLAIGYFLIQGLNSIWSDAVEGNIIPFYFNIESLIIAFFAGFIVTLVTILIISIKIGKMNIIRAMRTVPSEKGDNNEFDLNKKRLSLLSFALIFIFGIILFLFTVRVLKGQPHTDLELNLLLISPPIMIIGGFGVIARFTVYKNSTHPQIRKINRMILTFIGFVILIYTIILDLIMFKNPDTPFLALYFISGILLVFSSVLIVVTNLNWLVTKLNSGLSKLSGKPSNSVFKLATMYPVRSLKRTGMTIGLFSLVLFIIAALGVNIAIQTANISAQATTTGGGYDILGETSLPVKFDLSNPADLTTNDITSPTLSTVDVTPIKMVGEEGGTCSNMNVRYPPRLLGVDDKFRTQNKFGFSSSKWDIDDSNQIWSGLNLELDDNRIPIIVEYNTLVWIYEKELGSIFDLETESGEVYELEVVAITESSILSGSFIMSEENLDRLYPRSAEYHLFLFKLKNDGDDVKQVATSLEQELSELGLDTITIEDRLLDDVRYEQSFMALFQVFLGLGLIVGIVGLGVITLRAIQERRWEIGMLRALGFKRKMILKIFLVEIFFVVLIGIIIGILVGVLSSYLSFNLWKGASYEFVVPWDSLLLLALIVMGVTLLCAFYPAYKASKIPPVEALRFSE